MKIFPKTFVALIFLGLLAPIFAFAQSPGIPHKFYGTVNFSNGAALDGLIVEAKVGDIVMGTSATKDGNYGYLPDLLFAVNPDNDNAGKTVEFYVSGIKANETAIFADNNDTIRSTNLNLTVPGTVGTIEETDENAVIENKTVPVAPTQPTNIKLGTNLSVTVSSETDTNATINEIKKLTSDFFEGATAVIAGNNLLNAFEIDIAGDDLNILVTITYDDTGIDKDTIRPYRFDGDFWVEISPFSISGSTITFSVSSAETPYAVFGSEPAPEPTPPPAGGGGGGAATPTTYKTGDTDKNGKVDIFDFNTLMVNWGNNPANSAADLDGNGKVDIFDFNLLMVNWG